MTRLPALAPTDLDDSQRALYDAIAGGPRLFALTDGAGRLNGGGGPRRGPRESA